MRQNTGRNAISDKPGLSFFVKFCKKSEKCIEVRELSAIIRYMAKYKNNYIKDITNILKALGDENRVRIVMALVDKGQLCVCQIIELLGLAPSTVSKHLYILRQSNLIESNKKGRWVYYNLAGGGANKSVRKVLHWLQESLAKDAGIREDKKLLGKILKEDPERLCLKMKKR